MLPSACHGRLHRSVRCILPLLVFGFSCAPSDQPFPAKLRDPVAASRAFGVELLTLEVVSTIPHRTDAWTQGLAWANGALYESTGLVGESSLSRVEPTTGDVLKEVSTSSDLYGEGIAILEDRVVQLTWEDGVAIVYDMSSLAEKRRHTYEGEGWGICFDGRRLVMSDGTASLVFRDPDTFERVGEVTVSLGDEPVEYLNELECVGTTVYANVWRTDVILGIDPASGAVTSVVDARSLSEGLERLPAGAVLNGIAHDPDRGSFWLTGKLWRTLFEVRFVDSSER